MSSNPSTTAFELLSMPEKRAAAIDLTGEPHVRELHFINRNGKRL